VCRYLGSRNRLSEDFLADLQADWEEYGKEILSIMREKHPELYFQYTVKLALVHRIELAQSRDFDRPRSTWQRTDIGLGERLSERQGKTCH
jgi:hypothetical protein